MANQQKLQLVRLLQERLQKAKALYFADYQKLTASQVNELRQSLKGVGGDLKVIKNTLLEKADPQYSFKGPTAIILSEEDAISPLKTLAKFSETNNGLPQIKGGWLEGVWLTIEDIKELIKLPRKEVLLTRLVSDFSQPLTHFVLTLSEVEKRLILALAEVSKKKQGGEVQ